MDFTSSQSGALPAATVTASDTISHVLDKQISSLWGVVPCPPPAINATQFHYISNLSIDAAHAGLTLAFATLLLCCFSGVQQRVTFKGSLRTMLQILPCFRDLEHGATSNTRFVLYYCCSAAGGVVALLALLLDSHEASRGYRIPMQLAGRVFTGAAAVLLTIALNHQREHRHVDALHGDIGIVQLVGQIRRINYTVVIIYTMYMITELATSFVDQTHDLRVGMASFSFVVVVILNSPIFAAAVWIAFHKGHVAPSMVARVCLMCGVVFRFIGSIDPSFWNKLVFESWVDTDGCAIGGDLSFYNILQIVNLIGQGLLVTFVVSEFRRSRSIVTQESSLIATAQYDDFGDDHSSNRSEGDLQRTASDFRI